MYTPSFSLYNFLCCGVSQSHKIDTNLPFDLTLPLINELDQSSQFNSPVGLGETIKEILIYSKLDLNGECQDRKPTKTKTILRFNTQYLKFVQYLSKSTIG